MIETPPENIVEEIQKIVAPDLGGYGETNSGTQSVRKIEGQTLYKICKYFKPKSLIETGTHAGASTNYIAKYCAEENVYVDTFDVDSKAGREILDELKHVIKQNKSWFVWHLRMKLKKAFAKWGEIDFFFHDSDHRYDNVVYEMDIAKKHLKKGSVVVLHDVNHNTDLHGTQKYFNEVSENEFYKFKIDTPNGLGLLIKK